LLLLIFLLLIFIFLLLDFFAVTHQE